MGKKQKPKGRLSYRVLALFMAAIITAGSIPAGLPVYAEDITGEDTAGITGYEEDSTIDMDESVEEIEIQQGDTSETEIVDEPDTEALELTGEPNTKDLELTDEINFEDESQVETDVTDYGTDETDITEEDDTEEEPQNESNEVDFQLTDKQIEEKKALFVVEEELEDAVPGKDYVANEVIYLCGTMEEAEEAARAYSDYTGMEVTVKSFQYGVAVFEISGVPNQAIKSKYNGNSISSVGIAVWEAADTNTVLPPVYPNYYRYAQAVNTDNEKDFRDPLLKDESPYFQWHHELVGSKFVWKNTSLMEELKKIKVAVLDTGITINDDLTPDSRSKNFVTEGADTASDNYYDVAGHGTNVAGIIADSANSIGGRGVAPGVSILSIKVLSDDNHGIDSDILAGLNYVDGLNVDDRPKVVNLSLGGGFYNALYDEVFKRLHNKKITIVTSAGNNHSESIFYPACNDYTLSVGAVNSQNERSYFSNYGNWVDVAAPGGEYEVLSSGEDEQLLWTMGFKNPKVGKSGSADGKNYIGMQGTSQAAPVVAGAAALLYAAKPDITPDEIEATLKSTSQPVKNGKFAAGCIDIAEALESVGCDIDGSVEAPRSLIDKGEKDELVSGVIQTGQELHFDCHEDSVVYYTVNGKNPDVSNPSKTDTKIYNPGDPYILGGQGKVTVKAVTLLYGRQSSTVTYTYTYDTTLVSSISISPKSGIALTEGKVAVAVGKKVALTATVEPTYAKNKKLTWESSDTAVAKVDANGNVTGVSVGEAVITARATDGSDKSEVITVKVMPKVKTVAIEGTADTIELALGKEMNIDDSSKDSKGRSFAVKIYPTDASQAVTYASSNAKIVEVDATTGHIRAVKTGTAKITATAADGSGIKDTINVKVYTPVTEISITTANGIHKAAPGMTIKPVVTFNGGQSVPDNKKLTWSITEGAGYATINQTTGEIKVTNQTLYEKKQLIVKAESQDGSNITSTITIDIYPRITSLYANYQSVSFSKNTAVNIWDMKITNQYGSTDDLLYVYPDFDETAGLFTYTSSNKKAATIDKDGIVRIVGTGKTKITVAAADTSGKKCSFDMYVIDSNQKVGLISPMEHNVLYPGKSITFKLEAPSVDSFLKKLFFIVADADDYYYYYLDDNKYIKTNDTMKVSAGPGLSSVKAGTKIEAALFSSWFWDVYDKIGIELYPVGTKSISIDDGNTIELQPGEKKTLTVRSSPDNACQKYYKYASSNTKVATVDSIGRITALSNGTAKITVTAGDGSKVKATATVNVRKKVDTVEISSNTGYAEIAAGKTLKLTAAVTPANAFNKKVSWSVIPGSGVTIDSSGNLKTTAAALGTTVTVKATAADGSGKYDEMKITIKTPTTSISFDDGTSKVIANTPDDPTSVSYSIAPYDVMQSLKVTSSSEKILKASIEGGKVKLTPVAKGTATVKLSALDGTGKAASLKVTVEPKIKALDIYSGNAAIKELAPGKTIQLKVKGKDVYDNEIAYSKKVSWSIMGNGEEYATVDTAGKLKLKTAEDYSEYPNEITVKAISTTALNESVDGSITFKVNKEIAKKVEITENNEIIKAKSIFLGGAGAGFKVRLLNASGGLINTGWSVSSSNAAIADAAMSNDGFHITPGTKTGKASITVTAADGSGVKAVLTVTTTQPVRSMYIKSKTDEYALAAGKSLTMQAVTNADATNKGVNWSIKSLLGLSNGDVTIDAKGVVKTAATISSRGTVTIKADAKDGSGKADEKTVKLYPKPLGIQFAGGTTMKVGETITINITDSDSRAYQNYYVTYSTGCGKASYTANTNENGTEISVKAHKAGKLTLTAKAQDGSGIKKTYTITIAN